jgi:hypothetical protein
VDAVMIATPHHVLKESALAAIGQGKHVLAEKPIAVSEREATTLEEAAAQAGICYMAGYSLRFFDGQRWPAGAQDPRCRDRISPHPRTCQNRPTQQTPASRARQQPWRGNLAARLRRPLSQSLEQAVPTGHDPSGQRACPLRGPRWLCPSRLLQQASRLGAPLRHFNEHRVASPTGMAG